MPNWLECLRSALGEIIDRATRFLVENGGAAVDCFLLQ
jgi:hypothetical protein